MRQASVRVLRLPDVIEMVGLRRSSIYALVQAGKFPAPFKLSARASGWLETEVADFIAARRASTHDDGAILGAG